MNSTAPKRRRVRSSEKRAQIVAREIVQHITDRGLSPGSMLPSENAMLDELGVGRASLREALRILEVQGLISIKPGPGGGPVVGEVTSRHFGSIATLYFQMSGATFRELVQARLVLEPVMAGLAAQRHDPEVQTRLEEALAAPAAVAAHEDQEFLRATTDFHEAIASLSGNRVLDLFSRAIKEVFTSRVTGLVFPADDRERVELDHAAIARAILQHEPEKATELMTAHMQEYLRFAEARYPGFLDEVVAWR